MSSSNDERQAPSGGALSGEALSMEETRAQTRREGSFAAKLAEGYAPEPMTPARRVAFDDALRERIEGRGSPWRPAAALWVPAAAAAALAAVWLFSGDPRLGSAPSPAPSMTAEAWEEALLSPDVVADLDDASDAGEDLPEEYLAIASAFL